MAEALILRSATFDHGKPIPQRYTGDGSDFSPPLLIENVPADTASLALLVDDPDAPSPQPWVHWVIYNLPPDTARLPENVTSRPELANPRGALQGLNSWSDIGYRGPAPPRGHGVHHYYFKLYALATPLALEPGARKADLLRAMEGHVLAQAELIGTYERR